MANVSFNHVNTTYTINRKWANAVYPGDDVQTEMKSQLRVGGRRDLNLFYIPTWRGSGVCRFPFGLAKTTRTSTLTAAWSRATRSPTVARTTAAS